MAFDTHTRNLLAKMVADARSLLRKEFTDQLQEMYGIQPNGKMSNVEKLSHLDDEHQDIAKTLRERVEYLASGMGKEKTPMKTAVDRMTREQCFTLLNRFAALRMCEERGLIQECVGAGMNSKGFRVYEKIAGSALGDQFDRYRTFILSVFDEISVDLGLLFDRFSPFGLLFPRESSLIDLVDIINQNDLKHVWTEDETIGWVYQYFNTPEERRAMRKASAAPRNSRELAVRNQFFTPRYVVEFLTDNTLGRIWYEMRKGDTALKKSCRYLVRRPNEVFLKQGEKAPKPEDTTDLSQEELLKQPIYIEHRPKKDPRDIRTLDPACGSGHFLLYAFDLLEQVYEEAWGDTESPQSEKTGRTIQSDFETIGDLRRNIPKLIMEHNLHGIDIDPRAVQIAALALWLRAQKAWQNLDIKAVNRPQVAKSNIVTAEPMPGDEDMKKEFTEGLKPRVLGQLVDSVFDKMKLAGEAGSLLKIEEEIKDVLGQAKGQWLKVPKPEQEALFPEIYKRPIQQEIQFDLQGITDEGFWEQAESRILDALQAYAEQAQNGWAVRCRLFAQDAAHGFAFIDLCQKRYDVLLMNPPYGAGAESSKRYLSQAYPASWIEAYIVSCERIMELCDHGLMGAITSRTFMYLQKFIHFRKRILKDRLLLFLVNLGGGILDDAAVETAAWIFAPSAKGPTAIFFDLEGTETKSNDLISMIDAVQKKILDSRAFVRDFSSFDHSGNCSISYASVGSLQLSIPAGGLYYSAKPGLGTRDDFRFARLRWEVTARQLQERDWICAIYGGKNSKFYADHNMVINWISDGAEMKAFISAKYGSSSRSIINEDVYFKPGLTYQYTGKTFRVHVLPKNCIITMAGQGLYPNDKTDLMALLALLNSSYATTALKEINPGRFFQASYVNSLRLHPNWKSQKKELEELSQKVFESQCRLSQLEETSPIFCRSLFCNGAQDISEYAVSLLRHIRNGLHNLDKITASLFEISSESTSCEEVLEELSAYDVDSGLIVGFIFGRWDFRIALDPSITPKVPTPFDPLPICPPGMLVGPDGLPAEPNNIVSEGWLRARPDANTLPPKGSVKNPTIPDSEYPIRIAWDGILVDDPGSDGAQPHQDDIVRRVRGVLDLLWKDKVHQIEQEACEILGVSSLRDYFHKPTKFFQDHLKRYSKSRRKAPIYWPLSTESGSYTLWIYYHRLTDQMLFRCVNDYVEPKLQDLSADIDQLQKKLEEGASTKSRHQLEALMDLHQELADFKNELLRVAKLPYKPNLNDGVLITAAPLWRLFRHKPWHKDLKTCWEKLKAGEYDWAHLAYSIWPDRVREKCKKDRSLAIAHGLEEICAVEPPKKRK